MDKWKIRTKIEAGFGIIVVLMLLSVTIIPALTRTITSSSDTVDTYIRNSNGNYWAATGDNIRSAIWDLNSTGYGTVWLPSGNLTITQKIFLESDVALIGSGVNVTRIFSSQSGSFIPITVNGKQNVTLSDFTLDMNDVGSNGIYITGSSTSNVLVKNVQIVRAGYQGIYCSGGHDIILDGIRIKHGSTSAAHGISTDSIYDSIISNCIIENYDTDIDNTEDGLDIGESTNNVTIDNVIITGGGWYDGIKFYNAKYISASNIFIDNTDNFGVKCQSDFITIDNLHITNSADDSFWTDTTASHLNMNNIYIYSAGDVGMLFDNVDNISLSNAEIDDSAGRGLSLGTCKNTVVNNVRSFSSGSYNYIGGGSEIIITNGIFSYGSNIGLYIESVSKFHLIGSTIEYNAGDGIDTTVGACNNYTISNCYFKGNAKAMDLNSGDNWFLVTNCICDPGDSIDINAALSATRRVNNSICTLVQS